MSVSLEYLERCAGETGFQVASLEKVARLGDLAGDVARHGFLAEVLALKGGTALNLAFGAPSRLSVDLDFNYIGHLDREKMLADRPRVEAAVAELARRHGYRVQQSADAFAGRKLFLAYRSALGQNDRIEVDLNFLFRQPLWRTEIRTLWQPGELDRPRVVVVSVEELLIGKFSALLDRAAARDAWDVANLQPAARDAMGSPRFRPYFMAMAATLTHPPSEYSENRLARIVTDRAVEEQLTPMLASAMTPGAADLVRRSWAVVGPLVDLTDREQEFHAAVGRGDLRLDLLFDSRSRDAAALSTHPALLWKMVNVRQHVAKRQARTDT